MARAAALLCLVTAAACGGADRGRIVTFAGQLPEAVVPLAWLEGCWERPGGVLCFAAAGPALFGVQLGVEPGGFEALVVDAPVRRAQLAILPAEGPAQTLDVGGHGRNFASFSGIARRVRLERKRDGLVVTGNRGGTTRWRRVDPAMPPELDAAERGWVAGDALAPMERHIVAAALAPSGDLGFTIGFYKSSDGAQRGGYVAVWRRDAAGGWSLRFAASRRTP